MEAPCPLLESGLLADHVSQCPHKPGTPEWRDWQHSFLDAQTHDVKRLGAAKAAADQRIAAAGLKHTPQLPWSDRFQQMIDDITKPIVGPLIFTWESPIDWTSKAHSRIHWTQYTAPPSFKFSNFTC